MSYGAHLAAPELKFTDHRIRVLNDPVRDVTRAQADLDRNPRSEAAYLKLGQIFLTWNTYTPALEVFEEAAALFPDSVLIALGGGSRAKVCCNMTKPNGTYSAAWARMRNWRCIRRTGFHVRPTFRYEDAERLSRGFIVSAPETTADTIIWRPRSKARNATPQ